MSVDVRRRTVRLSGDSEGLSEDSYEDSDLIKGSERESDLNISSECHGESEYETLDEGGDEDSVSGDDLTAVDDDREDEDLSDSVIIECEREEGDGQESIPPKEKKLDDDEDRRNPQYIPKRGTFYEHDDRTADKDPSEDAADKDGERGKDGQNEKKKVWKEHESRWSHDRYNEDEQLPKSKEELVAIYGYDIRNEDAPPRARRRRKYGRGPNKYTRNWEDEDAYGKSSTLILRGTGSRRRGRGGRRGGGSFNGHMHDSESEFPPLGGVSLNREEEPEITSDNIYANRAAERRQERNRPEPRDAFPPLSPADHIKPEMHRNESSREDRFTGSPVNNAWRRENTQNRVEVKIEDDVEKSTQGNRKTNFSSNTSSSSSNTTVNSPTIYSNRNNVEVEDRKQRSAEDTRWKRDSGTYNRPHDDVEENDDADWRGRNRIEQSKRSGIPVESQTFTSSGAPRGRGRGIRNNPEYQSTDFKPGNTSRDVNRRGQSYRSNSETRVSSHDEESGSEGGSYPVQVDSHVVTRAADSVTQDMGRMSLNEQQLSNGHKDYSRRPMRAPSNYQTTERRQPVVPPRMQESVNKPKRYSSQRQKSLPETGAPAYVQPQPQAYYTSGYVPQPEELEGVSYVQQPVYTEAPQQTAVVQQPATTPPLALIPPHAQATAFAAPYPSPPFIPPNVTGPPPQMLPPGPGPYLTAPPTAPPILNYVPNPAQAPFPPTAYPAFQGYTAVPTAQPQELYQPQGGITYYSAEEQMMARSNITTQKRPRAAIPIVPPPEGGPRGRGRSREGTPTNITPGMPSVVDEVPSENSNTIITAEHIPEEISEACVQELQQVEEKAPQTSNEQQNICSSQVVDNLSAAPPEQPTQA